MNEAVIREKLAELCDAIARSPKTGSASGAGEGMYIGQGGASDASIDDALAGLRMQIKYVLFDLEATRRENRYLRQMLESRPGPGSNGGTDPGSGS